MRLILNDAARGRPCADVFPGGSLTTHSLRRVRTLTGFLAMAWVRKFDEPIALKDGRKLATLADAHRLIQSLPASRLRTDRWQNTRDLLRKAATLDGAFVLARSALNCRGR
jgi:hypothetical protein